MIKNIGIVGAGHMGQAFIKGLIKAENSNLHVLAHKPCNLAVHNYNYKILDEFLDKVDIIFFAVRPNVWHTIKAFFKTDHYKVSLMAGIALKDLGATDLCARIMPNLAVSTGQSVIGLYHEGFKGIEALKQILAPLGIIEDLKDEQLIAAITAVSGSGPAWLWHFIAQWIDSAVKVGFSEQQAQKIVYQTIAGTFSLGTNSDPKLLYEQVASKGGTTEAGLRVLNKANNLEQAIFAAFNKANALSGD